eukprot:Filipodium_phascolosomae@DN4631_c0_g1_i1.p1
MLFSAIVGILWLSCSSVFATVSTKRRTPLSTMEVQENNDSTEDEDVNLLRDALNNNHELVFLASIQRVVEELQGLASKTLGGNFSTVKQIKKNAKNIAKLMATFQCPQDETVAKGEITSMFKITEYVQSFKLNKEAEAVNDNKAEAYDIKSEQENQHMKAFLQKLLQSMTKDGFKEENDSSGMVRMEESLKRGHAWAAAAA